MFGLSKKENGLKIIIVGCGKVGANLVDQLSKEGHDITVIDKDVVDVTNINRQRRYRILPISMMLWDL